MLLKNFSRLATPRKLYRRYRKDLEHYEEACDHEEHFTERLSGKKNKKGESLADPALLGSLDSGGTYYFGGHRYDVSTWSLKLLEEIVYALNLEMTNEARARVEQVRDSGGAQQLTPPEHE